MGPEWLHWYSLIFVLPAALAVFVLLLSGLGGHRAQRGPANHGPTPAHGLHGHAHHGGSLRVGHAGHGHGAHARVGHGHARHHGHRSLHARGLGRQLLVLLGVGHAPVTIVLGSLMIVWGIAGIAALEVLRPLLGSPALFVPLAVVFAAASALLVTGLLARLASRAVPQAESAALTRPALVGLTGKVVFPVSDCGGRVHLFDQHRTLHSEAARVAPGQPPIERGTEVIVAGAERAFLLVEPLGFDTDRLSPGKEKKRSG